MDISGKVAIVTGAGAGIGAALARRLVAGGARVVVADLDAGSAEAVAGSLGADAVAVGGDVADDAVIAALVERAEAEFGPVDMFFANAGIGGGPGLDSTDAQWTAALEVNVLAHVRAARRLMPGWVERGSGYFVTTASAAGLLTQIGSAPYSVSKHAAVGFAEWLSVTYGDKGVRVSCLCPMGVDTQLLHGGMMPPENAEAAELAIKAVTTAGAVLTPEQVADAVIAGVEAETFLILPHPEVLKMYRYKGSDYDRWIDGMRRFQAALQAPTS
ncbi:SDR family oxidoreductase [Nocardia cyriacigeorgica]|uniref:SDR family oxidoreductase n=1 Tax=Nocardia cyriacigeorgica TaxID=135487 RepID=A0A6P1DBX1_9NOCA|nr:SDR family oxidoreductase [Nocardia cyriacigeorgica]NEW41808.1 SDR family oxidoreductase [Nocardia cyriacigeorgica]NEW45852.1 SDR family oxidoreductase [Nocardia cyriacigeorgica]NEW56774.1 SDR family oxidoreductase [Nocardia cyriacigeorgica]